MNLNYNGMDIHVEIIGGFKIDEKEYAVCSYVDSSENCKIVIVQVERTGNEMKPIQIPDEEMEFVLARYNEIKEQMLGGAENE